jgi:hypothetical protein
MKTIYCSKFLLSTLLTLFTFFTGYTQQTRYWVGNGAGSLSFNSTTNWSTTSGGTSGASVPGSNDTAIFDGANGFNADCSFSSTVTLTTLNITGYSGSITQGAILNVTGTLTVSSGTFTGATQAINLGGFIQNGGTFTTTSGTLKVTGDADFAAGTFNANDGLVNFHIGASGPAVTITGSPILNNISFSSNGYVFFHTVVNDLVANNITIDLSNNCNIQLYVVGSLRAKGNLAWSGSIGSHQLTGATIFVEKNILLNTLQANVTHPVNPATIEICGAGNQDLASTVPAGFNVLPKVRINKASGNLILSGVITVSGPTWTNTMGNIAPGTSTIYFYQPSGGALITVSGNQTLGNVSVLLDYSYSGLTVVNNLTVDNLTLNANTGVKIVLTGTVTVNNLLTLTGSGSNIVMNGGTIYAKGDIDLSASSSTLDALNTSTIEISGTGAQKFTGTSTLGQCVLPNVVINKPSGTLTLYNKITLQGNWTYIQGDVDASSNLSTVFFTQFSNSSIPTIDAQGTSTTMAFHHLRMSNPYPASVLIAGALDVDGDLRIAAGTTLSNAASHSIKIAGDLINAGTMTTNNATVTFDGTADQNVTANSAIINTLVTNKASGNITLLSPIAVKAGGTLVLTNGKIITTSANSLTLNNLSTTSTGSASSFVEGPVVYMIAFNGTRTVNLPIGSGGVWRPVELTVRHNSATQYGYRAEIKNSSAHALNYPVPAATIEYVSGKRYLQLESNVTNADLFSGSVKLSFGSDDEVVNTTKLGVAVAKSTTSTTPTQWTDISGGSTFGTGTPFMTGYSTSVSFVPLPVGGTFRGLFTLANLITPGINNPLPIELSSFTVEAENADAILKWETRSELNNDYFVIERSVDGNLFHILGTLKGAGTTSDQNHYEWRDEAPLKGYNYYRLKQVDFDKHSNHSKVLRFYSEGPDESDLHIYPMPSNGVKLHFNRKASVKLLNTAGLIVASGRDIDELDVHELISGIYFILDQDGKSYKVTISR